MTTARWASSPWKSRSGREWAASNGWRLLTTLGLYFEVSKDGDALPLKVLGHDIEDMVPTLLRALEKRFGVVSARADKREQARHEREQFVATLESTGTLEVASEGVRAVISGLSLPELKGTATQRQHASDVRAAELQGFIAAQIRQLSPMQGPTQWGDAVDDFSKRVKLVQGLLSEKVEARWWMDVQSPTWNKIGERSIQPYVQTALLQEPPPIEPPLSVVVTREQP